MKLRLQDGRVVEAEKDCNCLEAIHTGPHWIYVNDLWRAANQQLLVTGNVRGHIHEEVPRLGEKRRMMELLGVVEIIRD